MTRFLLLALLAAPLLSGCVGLESVYRDVERRLPDWADLPTDRRGGSDVRRDVDRYVDDVDRAVRLDRRQRDDVARILEDRAYDFLERGRTDRRDRRYAESPFPRRRGASREVDRWWDDADRAVERVLDRRQRDEYHRFVRSVEDDRYRRDRRYDDDDWDDDD